MHRIFIFSLLCFIAVCVGFYVSFPNIELSIGSFNAPASRVVERDEAKTTIRFVGDIMLARNVEHLMNIYGYSYPFSALPPVPQSSFFVGNFEGSIPKVHVPTQSMKFAFSVRPEYIRSLHEYGATHLSLANNHSYDFGVDDYEHTKAVLNEFFSVFGHQRTLDEESVTFIELASTTVAVIGVYAIDVQPTQEAIEMVLNYAQSVSDYQIAYVHFGTEYEPQHSAAQERLAQAFINAGTDAIVGHHPHVTQDIGLYKGAPIFYSLGNFVFDQYFSDEVQNGLMLDMVVTETGLRFEIIPVTSIGSRSQTRISGPFEAGKVLEDIAKKSDVRLHDTIVEGYVESAF
jgi:poly-gamma-glutamate synthesis protein (capsule biosynthesis protein)